MTDNATLAATPEPQAPAMPLSAAETLRAAIRAALDDPGRGKFITDRQSPVVSGAVHAIR